MAQIDEIYLQLLKEVLENGNKKEDEYHDDDTYDEDDGGMHSGR